MPGTVLSTLHLLIESSVQFWDRYYFYFPFHRWENWSQRNQVIFSKVVQLIDKCWNWDSNSGPNTILLQIRKQILKNKNWKKNLYCFSHKTKLWNILPHKLFLVYFHDFIKHLQFPGFLVSVWSFCVNKVLDKKQRYSTFQLHLNISINNKWTMFNQLSQTPSLWINWKPPLPPLETP